MSRIPDTIRRTAVAGLMRSLGGMVVLATRVDRALRDEVAGLPDPFVARLTVFPSGPTMCLVRTSQNTFRVAGNTPGRADLEIRFKHIAFAERVFGLRESTAMAVARNRVVIDGAVDQAMRVQRVIDAALARFVPAIVLNMRDRS